MSKYQFSFLKKELLRIKSEGNLKSNVKISSGHYVGDPEKFLDTHIATLDHANKLISEGKVKKRPYEQFMKRLEIYYEKITGKLE